MNANEEVLEIMETLVDAGGMLTPESVVEFASPEDSPLHPYFEWNDDVAAIAYRLEQARGLIRSVVIVSEKKPDVQMRAFVSMPSDRIHGAGYRRMSEVLKSPFLRQQLANEMLQQADAWRRRAEALGVGFDSGPLKRQAKRVAGKK